MNKSLLAVLLVCALAGLAYAGSYNGPYNGPYNEVAEKQDETEQAIQLLKALQSLEEMQDMEEEKVSQQQSVGKTAKKQWFSKALGIAHHLLGRK